MAEEFLKPTPSPEKKRGASDSPELSIELGRVGSRVRMIDSIISNLQRKLQITDQGILRSNKKNSTEIKTINSDINEIKSELNDLKTKTKIIITELQTFAKKEDVTVLKKYLDLWQPLNFITRSEVEKIIKEIIEEKLSQALDKK